MRLVNTEEVNKHLNTVSLKIGNWNQLSDVFADEKNKPLWINYQAPQNSRELHNFAKHVLSWIPRGTWSVLQIDNSTVLDVEDAFLIELILQVPISRDEFGNCRSFVIEVADDDQNEKDELSLRNLIFLFLLFECHVQIVSSDCGPGQYVSLQDGFVYFVSHDLKDIANAEVLLKRFESDPLGSAALGP